MGAPGHGALEGEIDRRLQPVAWKGAAWRNGNQAAALDLRHIFGADQEGGAAAVWSAVLVR
jgi:hypothetical protein